MLGEDVGPPGAGRLAAAVPGQPRGAGLQLRGGGVLPTPFRLLAVLQADMMAMFDCFTERAFFSHQRTPINLFIYL